MKELLAGAAVAACALGAAGRAEAMDVFVEGALGEVFASDVDVAGAVQTAESDPNAFVAVGLADSGGVVDLRLEYATTHRSCEKLAVRAAAVLEHHDQRHRRFRPSRPPSISMPAAGWASSTWHSTARRSSSAASTAARPFGWQAVGGARVRLFNSPFSAFGWLRYQGAGDAEIDGVEVEYDSASLMAGVRWTF